MLVSPVLDYVVLPHRYLTLSCFTIQRLAPTENLFSTVKKLREINQAFFTEIYLQSR